MAILRSRTNREWIKVLTGELGQKQQNKAFEDLAHYLYVIVYRNLSKRRIQLPILAALDEAEHERLAQDFVHQFMTKLLEDNYALLDKYSGYGRFTSWAAQVTLNLLASELRKACWQRRSPSFESMLLPETAVPPDIAALQQQIGESLIRCLAHLSERSRIALIRFVVEGDSAPEIAKDLGVSPNTVHILVHRAKKKMKRYLDEEDIQSSALSIFPI